LTQNPDSRKRFRENNHNRASREVHFQRLSRAGNQKLDDWAIRRTKSFLGLPEKAGKRELAGRAEGRVEGVFLIPSVGSSVTRKFREKRERMCPPRG